MKRNGGSQKRNLRGPRRSARGETCAYRSFLSWGTGEEGGKKRGSTVGTTRVYTHVYACARVEEISMRRDKRTRGDTTTSLKNVAGGKK